jgi:hypothetical protein
MPEQDPSPYRASNWLALASTFLVLPLAAQMLTPPAARSEESPVQSDETVLLFPTAAAWDPQQGGWKLPLHVWIFEPERSDLLRTQALRQLQSVLGLLLTEEEWDVFEDRARRFLVDNERGKRLTVLVGGAAVTLPPTAPSGHASGESLWRPVDTAPADLSRPAVVETAVLARDGRRFVGRVHLIPPHGISVISDIDDTIKVTHVRDREELLRNTFVRPFAPVPGMAELYRRWAEQGAAFHYVSNSPWQLYEPLAELLAPSGFPTGSVHLRLLRFKDRTLVDFLREGSRAKEGTILSLLDRWPGRKFILVGDSGEQDPEVYGDVARAKPEQVHRILIRNVTDEPETAERYQHAFREIPRERWQVFEHPSQVTPLDVGPMTPRDN